MFCHHRISFMELGHLLTRSGLTYPEVSSKVYHDSFCQLGSSVSLRWVIYFETFYLHVASSFSCIPVISPKLVLFITPLQFVSIGAVIHNTIAYPTIAYPTQQSSSQRCNYFTSNGGNAIPKHAGPEAKGSNPTTGLTLLWARNRLRGNFNHWQVSKFCVKKK